LLLQDVTQYAQEKGLVYMETSAKDNLNVQALFHAIGKLLFLVVFVSFEHQQQFTHSFTALLPPNSQESASHGSPATKGGQY